MMKRYRIPVVLTVEAYKSKDINEVLKELVTGDLGIAKAGDLPLGSGLHGDTWVIDAEVTGPAVQTSEVCDTPFDDLGTDGGGTPCPKCGMDDYHHNGYDGISNEE